MTTRRISSVTHVGSIAIGGDNPIRIQSMATTDTNDTEASVAQAKRIIDAGENWYVLPRSALARQRT